MATKSVLQLQFMTDENKKVHLSIPAPKQPVDAAAVSAALDLIVQKNIFAFSQGKIAQKIGAQLVQTDTTSIA
ncbi:DUF2922 domain-containing protein [Alicyclobacillus sp. SO9]|uniref:DUF2922 domain-containing protein n=1 Tax=Alicyclobacillus sp. SO9 TaxID=2665646 RepID=UPI0018E8BE33|nr:DUF2922 domain-containing protein [Alicyclobacillus sp. SO9]QQE78612.1 DUF2922 domain-containing protein [Alicyclobacillus sp. SO9]